MPKYFFALWLILVLSNPLFAQKKKDTTVKVNNNYITLSEIVVNSKLNIASFIDRIKNDTTFYKAFRNLRVIGYTSLNDIRMLDPNDIIQRGIRSEEHTSELQSLT